MKKRSFALLAGTLAIIIAAALFFRSADSPSIAEAPAAPAARPALTVSVEKPRTETLPIRLTANGNVAAWQEAVIGSDMAELRLVDIKVDVGDAVKAGQVLAVFDDEPVKVAVAQARAAVAEAQAAVAEARENANRARALEKSGALSRQLIMQYITTEQSAQARVAAAEAQLAAQQLRFERTQVLAPDGGVISSRTATIGAVVGLGGELFRMVRQGRIEWRAEMISSELGRVTPGTPVTLMLVGGQRVAGKVRMVAPTVDAYNRAGLVYVDLSPDERVRPGMFARGEFELGSSSAVTVPQQAVVMREAFNYIFALGDDGRVRQVKVATGRRVGDRVEITGGMTEGTPVVVAGAGFLNDGDLVRVADGTTVASSTSSTDGMATY